MQTADNHRKEWPHGFEKSAATNGSTLDVSANQIFHNHSRQIIDQKRIQCEVSHCGSCGKVFSETSDLLAPCEACCKQCQKTSTTEKGTARLQQESFTHKNMNQHQHPQLHHPHPTNNKHEMNVSSKADSPCSSSSSGNSSSNSSSSSSSNEDDDDNDGDKKYQTSSTITDLNCSNGSLTPPATLQSLCPGKSFQCDICGRSFTLVGNMQKHRKLHSGERPFSCDVCGRAFGLRGNLQKHKIIHTGVKLFHCGVCGKPFALRGNMQKHEIIHTGMKPFHCTVCDKRFTLRGNLQKHVLTHTDSARDRKPFPCSQCDKNFPHNTSLQNHIQSFHSQTENSEHSYHLKVKSSNFNSVETENEIHRLHQQRH